MTFQNIARAALAGCLGAALVLSPAAVRAAGSAGKAEETKQKKEEEIVARLQAKYDATKTLAADFVQKNELRSLGRTTRSQGVILLSKPGRLRVEYREPERQLIVSDGKTLWVYTPRLKQVIVSRLQQAGVGPTPLLFLSGQGDLRRNFHIELEDLGLPPRQGGVWKAGQPHRLRLTPREPNAGFQRMWLEINPETFQISALEYLDPMGNRSRIEFSHIREGVKIAAGSFHFETPPNTEVIRVPSHGQLGR